MSILDVFVSKLERQSSVIGRADCTSENVSDMLVGLMVSTGMSNSGKLTSKSPKGVGITKKGNKYTLTLYMFDPPIQLTWSEMIPIENLKNLINHISIKNLRAGSINVVTLQDGRRFVQLGIG